MCILTVPNLRALQSSHVIGYKRRLQCRGRTAERIPHCKSMDEVTTSAAIFAAPSSSLKLGAGEIMWPAQSNFRLGRVIIQFFILQGS